MNIFLTGYCHENLGDDLLIYILTQRYPQHTFHMLVHSDHAHAYDHMPNVKVHRQPKLLRGVDKVLSKISPKLSFTYLYGLTKELSVLVGGSMFQELAGDRSDLKRLALMPANHNKFYVLGINYGPEKTQAYYEACRKYLSCATDVCFREQTSYDRFSDLPNTRVGNDMVFAIRQLCPAPEEKKNTCIICPIQKDLGPHYGDYLAFLKEQVLDQVAQGRQVILASFCRFEGDEAAVEELARMCKPEVGEKLQTLYYDGNNYVDICRSIASAAYVVATRFHSMVLALAYGVPVTVISYSNKTRQLLKDMGKDDCDIQPHMLSQFLGKQPPQITGIDPDYWEAEAEKHFQELDKILNP